jgi:hypothetical protein
LCPTKTTAYFGPVTARYLALSPLHVARYAASNLATHGFIFWTTFAIPPDADLHAVDCKMLLLYDAHLPKEKQYRRRKAGLATVKYVRHGNVGLLMATKGENPFFSREPFRDIRTAPLVIAGHSIRVRRDTGKMCVRIHREAQRRLVRRLVENARLPLGELERMIWNLDLLPYKGVKAGVFAALRELNACRRAFRLLPVNWKKCVRKSLPTGPIFDATPPEVADLLAWYTKAK